MPPGSQPVIPLNPLDNQTDNTNQNDQHQAAIHSGLDNHHHHAPDHNNYVYQQREYRCDHPSHVSVISHSISHDLSSLYAFFTSSFVALGYIPSTS